MAEGKRRVARMSDRVVKPKEAAQILQEVCRLDIFFFVEANPYEKLCLWKEHDEGNDWEDVPTGVSIRIGTIGGLPIVLNFFFAIVEGAMVCFYYPCSTGVDRLKVQKFIRALAPTYKGRQSCCDAMNFHACLEAIRRKI